MRQIWRIKRKEKKKIFIWEFSALWNVSLGYKLLQKHLPDSTGTKWCALKYNWTLPILRELRIKPLRFNTPAKFINSLWALCFKRDALLQLDFCSRSTLFPETILPHPRIRPLLLCGKLQQWRREHRGVHSEDVRAVTGFARDSMPKEDFTILRRAPLLHRMILKVAVIPLNYQ